MLSINDNTTKFLFDFYKNKTDLSTKKLKTNRYIHEQVLKFYKLRFVKMYLFKWRAKNGKKNKNGSGSIHLKYV